MPSTVADMAKRACDVAERLQSRRGTDNGQDKLCPCLVASSMPAGDRIQSEARAQAEAAAFVKAAAAVPAGSLYAVAGGRRRAGPLRRRCGRRAAVSAAGAWRRQVLLFDADPRPSLLRPWCPMPHGGAEHKVEVFEESSQQFADRLRKVAKERRKWAAPRRRLVLSRLRRRPARLRRRHRRVRRCRSGRRATRTCISPNTRRRRSVDPDKARRRFDDVLALAPVVLGVRPDHVFSKVRWRDKGGGQYRDAGRRNYVTHGRRGRVPASRSDLAGYLDTGLFLDHRATRAMVRKMRRAASASLTCSPTRARPRCMRPAGGAVETVTVDLSQTYLDWAAAQHGAKRLHRARSTPSSAATS